MIQFLWKKLKKNKKNKKCPSEVWLGYVFWFGTGIILTLQMPCQTPY
jgi:hypothetical protein